MLTVLTCRAIDVGDDLAMILRQGLCQISKCQRQRWGRAVDSPLLSLDNRRGEVPGPSSTVVGTGCGLSSSVSEEGGLGLNVVVVGGRW